MTPSNTIDAAQQAAFEFFTNYVGNPDSVILQQEKLTNLTTAPGRLPDFLGYLRNFLIYSRKAQNRIDCEPLPSIICLTVSKATILRTLRYFERANCQTVKVCFGLDACLVPQLVISGSFWWQAPQTPSADLVDNPYRKAISNGRGGRKTVGHYLLNFTRQLSVNAARTLLKRFADSVTTDLNKPEDADLRGYALDIETFRLLLTDAQYLGKAKNILIRMGMNNDGLDPTIPTHSGRVRIMILQFIDANPNTGSNAFYMCGSHVKDDSDPTECPPRQPCNETIS
ncbi:hypothetical protein [Spirosoma aerolatum]|uniref:hypothetical protein n=1 Tax=Spirosoma aerolatum TaxID=1211326 RepID=UPI0009AF0E42|nr:hypothetical protein [Spirosoma aerolatum]